VGNFLLGDFTDFDNSPTGENWTPDSEDARLIIIESGTLRRLRNITVLDMVYVLLCAVLT